MPERRGYRPIDEVEKEPPKEAPIRDDLTDDTHSPMDDPDGLTPSNVRDDLEIIETEELPRMEPMGPDDKEAERWNREADAIEEWKREIGDPEVYKQDVLRRMYEPTDVDNNFSSSEVVEDLPTVSDDVPFESDISDIGAEQDVANDSTADIDRES